MDHSVLHHLRAAFSGRLLTEDADMAPFLTDWRGKWTGRAIAVAQPDAAEDVAAILSVCDAYDVPVVPQGGNTGLAGGSVPDDSGRALVLSLSRLNRIRSIDLFNYTMTVEAGCTLQQIQDAASEADRLFPLSLAAEGSCSIGGNLATNAGGVQVLRFGNARDLCLGLEGTLGVITAAVLKLHPLPAVRVAAMVAVPSPEAALTLFALARRRLDAALTAFELMSASCLDLVLRHIPGTRKPLESKSPWYVLLEISAMCGENAAAEMMESVLGEALDDGVVTDAALSSSLAQFEALWALRENISEAQAAEGRNIKHDISLPISAIPAFIAETGEDIRACYPDLRLVVFGHLGDGNLHYNLSPPEGHTGPEHASGFTALEQPVNKIVHDAVVQRGGSISAEHGLGVLRRDEAARYRDQVELRLMRAVKDALDPKGLMNPGKLLA